MSSAFIASHSVPTPPIASPLTATYHVVPPPMASSSIVMLSNGSLPISSQPIASPPIASSSVASLTMASQPIASPPIASPMPYAHHASDLASEHVPVHSGSHSQSVHTFGTPGSLPTVPPSAELKHHGEHKTNDHSDEIGAHDTAEYVVTVTETITAYPHGFKPSWNHTSKLHHAIEGAHTAQYDVDAYIHGTDAHHGTKAHYATDAPWATGVSHGSEAHHSAQEHHPTGTGHSWLEPGWPMANETSMSMPVEHDPTRVSPGASFSAHSRSHGHWLGYSPPHETSDKPSSSAHESSQHTEAVHVKPIEASDLSSWSYHSVTSESGFVTLDYGLPASSMVRRDVVDCTAVQMSDGQQVCSTSGAAPAAGPKPT